MILILYWEYLCLKNSFYMEIQSWAPNHTKSQVINIDIIIKYMQ